MSNLSLLMHDVNHTSPTSNSADTHRLQAASYRSTDRHKAKGDDPSPSSSSSEEENDNAQVPHDDDGGHAESGTVLVMTFNTITNVIGGGVLDLPNAMYQASIVVGVTLMVITALMSSFAVYALVKACDYHGRYAMRDIWALALFPQAPHTEIVAAVHRKRELEQKRRQIHEDVTGVSATGDTEIAADSDASEEAELDAFLFREEHNHKWRGRMSDLIVGMMILYNFGCLVLYGVVIGESIPPVVQNFFDGDGFWIRNSTWLMAAGVVFFAFTCARKMSELKWSSILGAVTIFYVIGMIVVRYFTLRANPQDMPSFNEDTGDVDVASIRVGLANAMTTFGLAFCYHYNVPYYYKELRDRTPKKMMMTVAFAQPVTFTSYLLTGLFGYLTFGAAVNNAHSGGNVVDNYAEDDTLVNIGRFGLFFHFVCVYPIISVACRRGLHHLIMTHIVRPFQRYRQHPHHRLHHQDVVVPHGVDERSAINQEQRGGDDMVGKGSSTTGGVHGHEHLHHHTMSTVKISMLESSTEEPDPARPIVALEAFCIVAASITCAWVAPGIKVVINITGSLFGLFMMMVAPGVVGVRLFHTTRTSGKHDRAAETRKYVASWSLVVFGVIFIATSFYTIVA